MSLNFRSNVWDGDINLRFAVYKWHLMLCDWMTSLGRNFI